MKLLLLIIKRIIIPLILILLMAILIVPNSLTLSVKAIQGIFSLTKPITLPERFEETQERMITKKEVPYHSTLKNNVADIIYPKKAKQLPVVFWVHGGAYVASSKESVEEYVTYLADEAQVAVISINYELAPDSKYPGQLQQLSEAVQYFLEKADSYPALDFSSLFIGGDSAGAQIAAQYLLTQTNDSYGKKMGIKKQVKADQVKGSLLLCGPYDLGQMTDLSNKNALNKFFVNTVGWALTGSKKWQTNPAVEEAAIVNHVTADFPPSYITDGNFISFPEQGEALVNKLEQLNVEVDTLFFNDTNKQIPHEYQFDFTTKEAKQSFEQAVTFVKKQLD